MREHPGGGDVPARFDLGDTRVLFQEQVTDLKDAGDRRSREGLSSEGARRCITR